MKHTRLISSLLVAGVLATSMSTAAYAGDRHGHRGGNGAAIAAGILGAVVVGSLIAGSQPAYAQPAPQPYVTYNAPVQTYYEAPVQRVYYEQPRVYAPPPPPQRVYVEERRVVRETYYRDGDYRDGYRNW